jgi:hypothetical protein
MSNVSFTRHGRVRAQQCGVRRAYIEAVIGHADMEARRGNGCSSIWISERELRRLGQRTPEGIPTDRLQGLMVLQGSDQACVTVVRNRRTRAYRRDTGGDHEHKYVPRWSLDFSASEHGSAPPGNIPSNKSRR